MDSTTATWLVETLRQTLIQLAGVFGIFFGIGYGLSWLQKKSNDNYLRAFGWKGVLWTAWIGTPIHELGHYLFAKLFHHRVEAVALFKPNEETGGLGHVEHSYKKSSIYQTLGNFFIGAAPMICGIATLWGLLYLVPNRDTIMTILLSEKDSVSGLLRTIPDVFRAMFSPTNLTAWQWWLFLYFSFAISSHIAPSKQDRKGMWSGFFWIVLLLFLVNAAATLLHLDITSPILQAATYLNVYVVLSLFALLMSVVHFLCTWIFLFPVLSFNKRRSSNTYGVDAIKVYDKRKN